MQTRLLFSSVSLIRFQRRSFSLFGFHPIALLEDVLEGFGKFQRAAFDIVCFM